MKVKIAGILIVNLIALAAMACASTAPPPTPIPPPTLVEPSVPPAGTKEPLVIEVSPISTPDTKEPVASETTPLPTSPEQGPAVFEAGPCETTLAVPQPIEFEYRGTVPTGFDGVNQAGCSFTKAVKTVTVVLTGPATHTETFTLEPPSTTREIVPPGEYLREMSVTSVDGQEFVVSGLPGVLGTVTILEPQG